MDKKIKVNKILATTLKTLTKGVNMYLFLLLNNFMQNGLIWFEITDDFPGQKNTLGMGKFR